MRDDFNQKAQTIVITTLLLILLILAVVVILWSVVNRTVTEGSEEIPGQTDCMNINLEIIRADNDSSNNLILERGTGRGELVGVRVFIDNKQIGDDIEVDMELVSQKGFDIESRFLKRNVSAPGRYLKIAKLVGNDLYNARICEFSGKSSRNGIVIVSNYTK